jgi:hypothetical protein
LYGARFDPEKGGRTLNASTVIEAADARHELRQLCARLVEAREVEDVVAAAGEVLNRLDRVDEEL